MKLSWKLSNIKLVNEEYHLTYETPEGLVSVRSKSVVLTVPSHVASILLRPLSVSTVVLLMLLDSFLNMNTLIVILHHMCLVCIVLTHWLLPVEVILGYDIGEIISASR